MCGAHYQRLYRAGDLRAQDPIVDTRPAPAECDVPRCGNKRHSRGYCCKHYQRVRTHGTTDLPSKAAKPATTWITRFGYRIVYLPQHPMANSSGAVAEHRLVMSQTLGRDLLPQESVHHINGDRLDNRSENLELWSKAQPAGQRVSEKVAWAIVLLKTYQPELLSAEAMDDDVAVWVGNTSDE